jgi:EAL domain-containing protein (putative c-di-GMP-specific phosphodiesterase class I)
VKVVAEGVETPEQEARLLEFGCDFGQGYLYGRPLPIQEAGRQWFDE